MNLLGPERFDEALRGVLQASPFHPTISEIRKAAGINHGICDPNEKEAMAALRTVLEAMRVHGPHLRPVRGKEMAKRGENREFLYEPATPAPALSERTEKALVDLGFGSREAGLELVACHPALNPSGNQEFRLKNQADLEKKWMEAWRQA